MKLVFLMLLLTIIYHRGNCQQVPVPDRESKDYYIQKSKKQKTAGWILLGAGAGLITTAFIVGNSNDATIDDIGTSGGLVIAGTLAGIGSIPLFIASSRNKRKAARASVYIQNEEMLSPVARTSYLAASIIIKI